MNERIHWIDGIKGFVILLVVMGHICDGYLNAGLYPEMHQAMRALFHLIYSFHMPLFMTISGMMFYYAYCQDSEKKRKKYKKQVCNLALLYIIYSIFEWGLKLIFSTFTNHTMSWRAITGILVQPLGELWYIYVLIVYYFFFYWAWKKGKMVNGMHIIFLIGSFLAACFPSYSETILYKLIYYAFFFDLGIYLQEKQFEYHGIRTFSFLIGMILCLVFSFAYQTNVFGIKLLLAFCCTMFFLSLFALLSCANQFQTIVRVFSFVGKHSLEIYLIHCYITSANRFFLTALGVHHFYINVTINFLMASLIPIGISMALKRMQLYHYLFKPADLLFKYTDRE